MRPIESAAWRDAQTPRSQPPTISVCVPTHGRLELLAQTLDSVLSQTLPPDELLISDDLGSREVHELIACYSGRCSFPARYSACTTGIGLAENVNHCFQQAASDLVVLLHDDDLLFPSCLAMLREPFLTHPNLVASYGRQMIVKQDGTELPAASMELNNAYQRTPETAGLQKDAILSGILRQFPNDGYMISTQAAKKVLHNPAFGAASEVDFGIRCGEHGEFFFVDEYTAKYRLSAESLGRGVEKKRDNCGYFTAQILLRALAERPEYSSVILRLLRREIPIGISQAINIGDLAQAAAWLTGPHHRGSLLTPGGMRRTLRLLLAAGVKHWGRNKARG